MADLTSKDSSQNITIVGASTTGVESNYVDATSAGGLHTNLRNSAGTEIGTASNPVKIDPTETQVEPLFQ